MKCPHCLVNFHGNLTRHSLSEDKDGHWSILRNVCPSCQRFVLELVNSENDTNKSLFNPKSKRLIYPKGTTRPVPPEVPLEFAQDFVEAALVLPDSPKASAALSRRCLQHLLREKAGVKKSNLAAEIQEVIDSKSIPPYLAETIDGVRNIGNFAAHPIKSTSTGEVVPVEPGEAEWNLDVLEAMFEFYFVQPKRVRQQREALDRKLADAGKPTMK